MSAAVEAPSARLERAVALLSSCPPSSASPSRLPLSRARGTGCARVAVPVQKSGACAGCTRGWASVAQPGLVCRPLQGAVACPHCLRWLAASTRHGRVDSLIHHSVYQLPLGCNFLPYLFHSVGTFLYASYSSARLIVDPLSWEGRAGMVTFTWLASLGHRHCCAISCFRWARI